MKKLCVAMLALSLAGPVWAADPVQNPLIDGESWAALKYDVLGDAEPGDGRALFEVEAPYRAHDAATVPVVIRQIDEATKITKAFVIIDENPAPVAAELHFGPSMGVLDLELRVRVNQYSNVRVIAETPEGLAMNGRFVKASGGCSAPATRDPELALASMGQMKLKSFAPAALISTPRQEAQIMIRHPNYSGLQRDQITQLFITAHFINELEIFQGEDLLFSLTGGISISENPVFRFKYDDNGADSLRVRATDTEGNVFERVLPKGSAT